MISYVEEKLKVNGGSYDYMKGCEHGVRFNMEYF